MEPTAWPDGAYSWIKLTMEVHTVLWVLRLVEAWPHDCLFHPFWSSAGPAEGPTGPQFGSRVVQAWPKDRLKRPLLEKRGTSPKQCYLIGPVVGWTLAGIGQLGVPEGAPQEAMDSLVPVKGHKGSIGIYGAVANERKWTETYGNGWKQTQTQAGSEVKIYLKAKTYD